MNPPSGAFGSISAPRAGIGRADDSAKLEARLRNGRFHRSSEALLLCKEALSVLHRFDVVAWQ